MYANDNCMWGRGFYFAVNSSYSAGSYAYHDIDNTCLIMLFKVLIGDTIQLPPNNTLKGTPINLNKPGEKYDSIEGNQGGAGIIYIIHKARRAYPNYLIRYEIK